MALPASGTLAISQISVELGRASTATTNLNESAVRSLAGVASGSISISNFYGKSSGIALTIASNTNNYNVRSAAVAAGWPGSTDTAITVTLNPGVYVGSTSTGSYAFDVGTPWPAGSTVTLVNQGTVVGRGGDGGRGGSWSQHGNAQGHLNVGSVEFGLPGSGAGGGLVTTRATIITNNGQIAGGGGGGGGGNAGAHKGQAANNNIGGGGGGGIGGGGAGPGGLGYSPSYPGSGGVMPHTNPGQAGSYTAAGAGGAGSTGEHHGTVGGPGGSGGSYGSGGSSGNQGHSSDGQGILSGSSPFAVGSGGAAGGAVSGNPYITWPATGQRDGSVA